MTRRYNSPSPLLHGMRTTACPVIPTNLWKVRAWIVAVIRRGTRVPGDAPKLSFRLGSELNALCTVLYVPPHFILALRLPVPTQVPTYGNYRVGNQPGALAAETGPFRIASMQRPTARSVARDGVLVLRRLTAGRNACQYAGDALVGRRSPAVWQTKTESLTATRLRRHRCDRCRNQRRHLRMTRRLR